MKLRIAVTVDLTPQQVRDLSRLAAMSGFGSTKAPGQRIRRYLESQVTDTVYYAHEKIEREESDDD